VRSPLPLSLLPLGLLALAACGTVPAAIAAPAVITAPSTPEPPAASPSPAVAATPAPTAAAVMATAVPPAAMAATFPLVAIGGSGVSGRVVVTAADARSFSVSLSLRGLPTGRLTAHTVHLHAGGCAAPYAGLHLTVLGTLLGDRSGAGGLEVTDPNRYVAPGRYLIVYATTSPAVILACADLGPLATAAAR
jgi:hypothetical protein